jgi:IS5 family transposase
MKERNFDRKQEDVGNVILLEHLNLTVDMTHRRHRRGGWLDPVERRKNRRKSRVRAEVEHAFLVLQVIFGLRKARYRGIAKNAQRLNGACALINLFMLRRPLLRLASGTCR